MKRFIFNQNIEQEIVEKFISFVESNPDDHIHIYLTSNGGAETGMIILLDIINSQPERFTITALEKIYSAAFELFFLAKCERRIAPATLGMCHLTWQNMSVMSNGAARYDEEKAMIKAGKCRTDQTTKLLSDIGVSYKDRKDVLKGEDVYFQFNQMVSFLNFQIAKNTEMAPYDHSGNWVTPSGTS